MKNVRLAEEQRTSRWNVFLGHFWIFIALLGDQEGFENDPVPYGSVQS